MAGLPDRRSVLSHELSARRLVDHVPAQRGVRPRLPEDRSRLSIGEVGPGEFEAVPAAGLLTGTVPVIEGPFLLTPQLAQQETPFSRVEHSSSARAGLRVVDRLRRVETPPDFVLVEALGQLIARADVVVDRLSVLAESFAIYVPAVAVHHESRLVRIERRDETWILVLIAVEQ